MCHPELPPPDLTLTRHARERGAQRRIAPALVELVARYGRREYGHGAIHYFFGRREARRHRAALGRLVEQIEDIVVVATMERRVLTVYRNRHAPRLLRRKRR
jgi:hypothetical protein